MVPTSVEYHVFMTGTCRNFCVESEINDLIFIQKEILPPAVDLLTVSIIMSMILYRFDTIEVTCRLCIAE